MCIYINLFPQLQGLFRQTAMCKGKAIYSVKNGHFVSPRALAILGTDPTSQPGVQAKPCLGALERVWDAGDNQSHG